MTGIVASNTEQLTASPIRRLVSPRLKQVGWDCRAAALLHCGIPIDAGSCARQLHRRKLSKDWQSLRTVDLDSPDPVITARMAAASCSC
jgi:hypothetical protein